MRIDHAFAQGTLYSRKQAFSPSWWDRLLRRHCAGGLQMPRTAHDVWSLFEENAHVGKGCKLGPNAWCLSAEKRITLGRGVICRGILRCDISGEGEIVIGEDAYIGDDVIIFSSARVSVGTRTLIAQGVEVFDNDTHPLDPQMRWQDFQFIRGKIKEKPPVPKAPVEIGDDCWLGSGAFIGKGVSIGAGSVVAARSVVTHSVPPRTLVAGNPARVIRQL